jgi:prolyl oligopeptidase
MQARRRALATLSLLAISGAMMLKAQPPTTIHGANGITLPPPPVATVNVVTDDYNGTKIEDPYRWLEDAKSPATRAWIDQENAYTQQYLSQISTRPQIASQLTSLMRVDQYSMPTLRAGKYFFKKRLADQNQGSIFMRIGWHGEDQLLIDANKLSADQNTSVTPVDVSDDGNLLVYEIREGGADEGSVHIRDVKSGHDLPDVLPSARYSGVSLSPDNHALYYSKFTHQGSNVWFHKFGTPVADDPKIFGGEFRGKQLTELDLVGVNVTDNHHYLIVNIAHGVPATSEDFLVKDLRKPDSDFETLVYGVEAHVRVIDSGDPRHRLLGLENHRPRRQRSHRRLQHRRRQALRLPPPRRQNRNHHLHPRRQADRHPPLSRHRHRHRRLRPPRPDRRLLLLRLLHHSPHHLSLRHKDRPLRHLRRAQSPLRLLTI